MEGRGGDERRWLLYCRLQSNTLSQGMGASCLTLFVPRCTIISARVKGNEELRHPEGHISSAGDWLDRDPVGADEDSHGRLAGAAVLPPSLPIDLCSLARKMNEFHGPMTLNDPAPLVAF